MQRVEAATAKSTVKVQVHCIRRFVEVGDDEK